MCGELSVTAVLLCFKVLLVLFGNTRINVYLNQKFSKCVHVDCRLMSVIRQRCCVITVEYTDKEKAML